jgi:hypothetical protein
MTTVAAASSMLFYSQSIHNDDASSPGYLELEVGVARYGHKLHVTWLPQEDVVGPKVVDHLKNERFGVVVASVSEGDRQSDPHEGDELLA